MTRTKKEKVASKFVMPTLFQHSSPAKKPSREGTPAVRLHPGERPAGHRLHRVMSDLLQHLWRHRHRADPDAFPSRDDVTRLVRFELFATMPDAIARENG